MSHLEPQFYTEKEEKIQKTGNKKTVCCVYTLKGGGYLCMECEYEVVTKEWGEDCKMISCNAYCKETPIELTTKQDELEKLLKIAEYYKK